MSSDLNSENLHQRNTRFPLTAVSHILCRHQWPPLPRCPQSRSPARNGSQSRPAWSPRSASEAGRKHRWIPYRIWHENTLICRAYLRIFHFFSYLSINKFIDISLKLTCTMLLSHYFDLCISIIYCYVLWNQKKESVKKS